MRNLSCSFDIGQSSIDEMCLSVFLDLEDRPDKPLNHRFVIDKTFPGFCCFWLVDASMDIGVVIGVAWVHSNYYNISRL